MYFAETPLCVCQSFILFYSSTRLMSLVCAFVDVDIFCRWANYIVQLQNIQKVKSLFACIIVTKRSVHRSCTHYIINGNILHVNYLSLKPHAALVIEG